MKLEDIVCTLEQSRVISGVFPNLKSIFGWFIDPSDIREIIIIPMTFAKDADKKGWVYLYPAFTTSELGVLLPDKYLNRICKSTEIADFWQYFHNDCYARKAYDHYETEAQARSAVLIELIENDFEKVEDLKL